MEPISSTDSFCDVELATTKGPLGDCSGCRAGIRADDLPASSKPDDAAVPASHPMLASLDLEAASSDLSGVENERREAEKRWRRRRLIFCLVGVALASLALCLIAVFAVSMREGKLKVE